MPAHTVESSRVIPAPPERVFELIADVRRYPEWGVWDEAAFEREGDPAPGGVGAVRSLRAGRTRAEETVTLCEAPRRFGYALTGGSIPVRDYEALVTLEPADGGTLVTWGSSFRGRFPGAGTLVQRRLQPFYEEMLERLALHAG